MNSPHHNFENLTDSIRPARPSPWRRAGQILARSTVATLTMVFLWTASSLVSPAQAEGAGTAGELRTKFTELSDELAQNQFRRPIHLDSQEGSNRVRGDVFAVVNHPFAKVDKALRNPANWCDVMILHPNTKHCDGSTAGGQVLHVSIGKKLEQPVEDAYPLDLTYSVAAATADYFQVQLHAKQGPLGTSDYRIVVEAVSVPGGRTFLHLSYAYGSSFAGQMATKAYLATAGRSKVGFSTVGQTSNGEPQYIGGVRGAVERNAMRYYLAIEAYLQSLNAPPASQFDRRLNSFFAALEQYPRQLHEMDRDVYIAMKQRENDRQQKTQGL